MRIRINQQVCIGAGMCALTTPAVFTQDDTDGRVVLLEPEPSPELEATVRDAAGLCPSGAITIDEATGSREGPLRGDAPSEQP